MRLKDSRRIELGEIRMVEEYIWRGRIVAAHARDPSASQHVVLHRMELSHRGAGESLAFIFAVSQCGDRLADLVEKQVHGARSREEGLFIALSCGTLREERVIMRRTPVVVVCSKQERARMCPLRQKHLARLGNLAQRQRWRCRAGDLVEERRDSRPPEIGPCH